TRMKTERKPTRKRPRPEGTYVCPLADADEARCGGKAHNLGRMLRLGFPVPPGFVVTDRAFEAFLDANSLREPVAELCCGLDARDPAQVRSVSQAVRARVTEGSIPASVKEAIHEGLAGVLSGCALIVRSSAVGEDGAGASFAGQLDSFP